MLSMLTLVRQQNKEFKIYKLSTDNVYRKSHDLEYKELYEKVVRFFIYSSLNKIL
jgi:hypothetical protein